MERAETIVNFILLLIVILLLSPFILIDKIREGIKSVKKDAGKSQYSDHDQMKYQKEVIRSDEYAFLKPLRKANK